MMKTNLFLRLAVSLMLVALAVPVAPESVQAQDWEVPSIADGVWQGNYNIQGTINFSGGSTVWTGQIGGDVQLTSQDGSVDGTFSMDGVAVVTNDGGSGDAIYKGEGIVAGSAVAPVLNPENIYVDISGTAMGIPFTYSEKLGASGGSVAISLVSATCNMVTGDVTTGMQSIGSGNLTGTFVLRRVGNVTGRSEAEINTELANLIGEAEALKAKAIETNAVSFDEINTLVSKASELNANLTNRAGCNRDIGSRYQTVVTEVMADLFRFALDNPQLFDTETLGRLAVIALETGVWGSGAVNQAQAQQFRTDYIKIMEDRLDDARDNEDCQGAVDVLVFGSIAGDQALTLGADALSTSFCGG